MVALTSFPLAESDQYIPRQNHSQHSAAAPARCWASWKRPRNTNRANSSPVKFLSTLPPRQTRPSRKIYSVVTFYALFNLEPQGKNTICICRGTACHTRGSRELLESLMFKLGFHNPDDELADKIALNTGDGEVHDSNGGMLWPMRARARGGSQSRGVRPYERADAATRA